MAYRHRVTVRVTKLDGHKGCMQSSRIVYAEKPADITAPLDEVLNDFPFDEETIAKPTKSAKK